MSRDFRLKLDLIPTRNQSKLGDNLRIKSTIHCFEQLIYFPFFTSPAEKLFIKNIKTNKLSIFVRFTLNFGYLLFPFR